MEPHDELVRFIDFDDSDVERIAKLGERLAPTVDAIVEKTCRDLSVDEPADSMERFTHALSDWLGRLFEEPFARSRPKNFGALERMVHLASPWTECLLATLHRLRRHLSHHIQRCSDFPTSRQRELTRTSLEKAFDFEVLRLVEARHRADLRGSLDSVASLASGLSHEIYNPLNSISLHLSLLERQLLGERGGENRHEGHEDGRGYSTMLAAVREEIRRIANFTSELNDFSRPLILQPVRIDVEEFLEDFLDAHAATLASADVTLTQTATDTPQSGADSSRPIYADIDLLEEALLNLVQNAVEAMETNGSIELRLSSDPSEVWIDVVDSGPGFVESASRRAFDLFFTTKAAGTGLGLPIVRKITRAHGGRVRILSEDSHRGAAVRLSLPKADSDVAAETDGGRILQELQSIS